MHNLSLVAAAGWAEGAAQSIAEGGSLLPVLVFLSLIAAVGVLAYLLLQRFAELMIGRWRTTIRELLLYTLVVALLCTLLLFIGRMYGR